MPMLAAGLQEMLVLTATSHTTLRSQRHRGTAVAAFGTTQPLLDTRWLLIDGAGHDTPLAMHPTMIVPTDALSRR